MQLVLSCHVPVLRHGPALPNKLPNILMSDQQRQTLGLAEPPTFCRRQSAALSMVPAPTPYKALHVVPGQPSHCAALPLFLD